MDKFFSVIFDSVYIVQILTISISLVILFFPNNYKIKKQWPFTLISFAFALLINFSMTLIFTSLALANGIAVLMDFSFTLSYLFSFLIIGCLMLLQKTNSILTLPTFLAIDVVVLEFSAQLMRLLINKYNNNFDFVSILGYIFILVCAIIMKIFSMDVNEKSYHASIILMTILDFLSIAVVRSFTLYHKTDDTGTQYIADIPTLICFFSLYIILISAYLLTYQLNKEEGENLHLAREKIAINLDKKIMQISNQNYEDIRLVKHDMKNQLSTLSILLKEEKYDDAKKYFKELYNSIEGVLYRIDTGNETFNAVINLEASKARSYNINFSTNLIVPKEVPFSSSDICSLISNSCDNAMEYVSNHPEVGQEVYLSVVTKGEYLYINVRNQVVKKVKTLAATSKKDSANHGYGHVIMERIAKIYNGYALFDCDDQYFNTQIMLDLKAKKEA